MRLRFQCRPHVVATDDHSPVIDPERLTVLLDVIRLVRTAPAVDDAKRSGGSGGMFSFPRGYGVDGDGQPVICGLGAEADGEVLSLFRT